MSATRSAAVLSLALGVLLAAPPIGANDARESRSTTAEPARLDLKPGFEENRGQEDSRVRFVSRGARQTLFLTDDEAVLALRTGTGPAILRLRLRGANHRAGLLGLEPLPVKTFYARPETTGLLQETRTYQRIRYAGVYPGVDLEYYRTEQHLEFDFTVAPHADPGRIAISLAGADTVTRTADGQLILRVGGEHVVLKRPIAFQMSDGVRRDVAAEYSFTDTAISFTLGEYDRSQPLVIDPVIVYATYLGGTGDDFLIAADVNDAGDLFLFGRTNNGLSFPQTYTEPAQHTIDPINCFVSKVSSDGTALQYSVIFEGFGICEAFEVDGDRVHVGMQAQLGNFNGFAQLRTLTFDPGDGVTVTPLKGGTFGQVPGRPTLITDIRSDEFGHTYVLYHQLVNADTELQARLLKVDESGNPIDAFDVGVSSDAPPAARAMAVDNFGQVVIVGSTSRTISPTSDAFQSVKSTVFNCPDNGFLIRINTNTLPFQQTYASYIAGNGCDTVLGVVRDPLGFLYLTGRTTSEDLPIPGAPALGGPGGDGFLMKFDLSQAPGSQLLAARYLGLQLGTGSEGVADVDRPLIRLPNGLLALTGGAIGATFPLQNQLYDASGASGFPRFLQLFSPPDFEAILSTHLDAAGAATHAVAAGPKRNRISSPQNYLFVVTNTPETGLSTPGTLQNQPGGAFELLIRKVDHSDLESKFAPHVDLGPDITIEAADADGADFDLSCIGCDIVDLDESVNAYYWTVDGVRHTLTGPPFVGQVTLPVGTHYLELVVTDTSGAIGADAFVVTVLEPTVNRPPDVSAGADQTVSATSPDGILLYLMGTVSDPDNDTLDVTWLTETISAQFEVFPPYYSGNAAIQARLPIGTNRATLRVSDNHGHIESRDVEITVLGSNTGTGSAVVVTPIDSNTLEASGFTPGRIRITFTDVTAEGLTHFRTRTNQIPAPNGPPDPKQLGSSPFYYDVTTTAETSGNIRLCIDTTGMSFVDRSAIRLHRLNGTTWVDVTASAAGDETAANLICGIVPSSGPDIGTFAIFTPAAESTRVTTIIGNGGPFEPGNPAPGDGGPAHLAPIHFPNTFVIDLPRQTAYVGDAVRIRRVDLQANTISTFAGNGGVGIYEADGALASEINVSAGGLAVDRNGNVFISGINGCSILRIDVDSRRVRRVAGRGPDPTTLECRYEGDGGLATDADINGAGRIVFDSDGNLFFLQTVFSSVLAGPGKAVRRIAAGDDHLVTGDDPAEIITTVAGGGTQWPPLAGDPRESLIDGSDIAFNQQGDLYIGGTAVVVRITPAPGASVIDGRPGEQLTVVVGHPILTYAPYQGDGGPALDANLNGVWGIDFLPSGDLLLADMSASRIRMVTAGDDHVLDGGPGEIISTIAGFTPNVADINIVPFGGDGYALSTAFSVPRDVVADPRGGFHIIDTGFNRIRHVGPLPMVASRADIEVTAEASSLDTGINTPVTYHVLITNHGPATATNAGVEMAVPHNVRVESATSAAGFCIIPLATVIGGTVFCEARTMAPGSSVMMTIVLNPIAGDDLTTTFTGGASQEDPVPDNNSATTSVRVVVPIDLGVTVSASAGQVHALQAFTYSVSIANISDRAARIARMNATLPPQLRFDGATPPGICESLGNLVTCDVEPFAGHAALDISLNVTALGLGTMTSTFVVSNPDGDSNPANDSRSVDVLVDAIVIGETIRVSDGPPTVTPAAMIPAVLETIHVSDGPPTATGAVMIPVDETIHVSDAPRIAGPNVSITKQILDERGLAYTSTTIVAGEVVTFRLRATNQAGTAATSGPITVTDVLDSRLGFVLEASDQRCGHVGQTITCTAAAPLAAGASVDFLVLARIASDAAAPNQTIDIVNQATVATAGDENPSDNTSNQVTVTVQGPPPGAPTGEGPNVIVTPTDLDNTPQPVTLTFTNVTRRGWTTAVPIPPPAPPAGFRFRGTVYEISTTAIVDPPIEVCFLGAGFGSLYRMWHAGLVVPVPAHTAVTPTRICAIVNSLSPFGLVSPENAAPTADAGAYPPFEASSPAGATVTLLGRGTDPDGDSLSFTWTEGATPLGSGAQLSVALALGAHDITLTVSDGNGGIAASSTRVIVADTKAPAVTAPAAITIPATEAAGARGSAWAALAAYLAGGTATDVADPTPVRLEPQAGGTSADGSTLFPIGTTPVAFRFRDASGNIGTATSRVTVVVGAPKIAIQVAATGVVAGNRKFVDLLVSNNGNGNARQLTVDLIAVIPISGLGVPKLVTPIPVVVGSLDAGSSTTVRITVDVPKAVKKLSITEIGTFRNVKGVWGAYLETQQVAVPQP